MHPCRCEEIMLSLCPPANPSVTLFLAILMYGVFQGDSRAVLCSATTDPAALSHDHKPNRPDERQRIEQLGGCVLYNRVMGRLGVSRAFGDKSLKDYVTSEPEIISMDLTEGKACPATQKSLRSCLRKCMQQRTQFFVSFNP